VYTGVIHVKPYVAKYIFARYRYDNNIWQISKEDRIGKFVYNMLERVPRLQPVKVPKKGSPLVIGVSDWYFHCKGIYLSPESVNDLNAFIRLELIEEILEYIHKLRNGIGVKKYKELFINQTSNAGIKKRKAIMNPRVDQYFEIQEIIYDVFKQYDITEEDYSIDNIRKDIQRLKLPLLMAS
jgi:hypothetical protein